ncbi:hypothetical protein GF312_05115 [Candidatus Poribacteria bacterium]|nr:hypothetical protein [Candidatus Poribacteria bacterium]
MDNSSGINDSGVTLRAIFIGLLLLPLNAYWITKSEVVLSITHATTLSLFFNVIFIIFVFTIINLIIKKYFPGRELSPGELLTIYVMLCIGTSLLGWDMMQILVPVMTYGTWFATPENEWADLFGSHIPEWLVVNDKDIIRGYYEGNTNFYDPEILNAWLKPILLWTGFTFVLYFTMICIVTLIRKRWTEEEKLSYPIIQLPMEMTLNSGKFFRNKSMWLGFSIVFAIDMLHGFNRFYPFIPTFKTRFELAPLFNQHPWNAIGWLPICFYPFVIGLAYFMPLDLSFSTWFFYLFWKAQLVLRAALGFTRLSGPYLGDQSMGAWLGLGILSLWLSRKSIFRAVRSLWSREKIDDSREPLPYPLAVTGVVIGFGLLVLFSRAAGMSIWVAVSFFILYFITVLAATRMRAELGPPTHDLYYGGPDRLIPALAGTRRLGNKNLSVFTLYFWITRDYRCHAMPHQLEGFKIAERTGINSRKLLIGIMIATIFGIIVTFWSILHLFYENGATSRVRGYALGVAAESFNRMENWMNYPTKSDPSILQQVGFGMGLTIFLMIMRRRFLGFPFHPVGFAVAGSWTMSWMWFSVFLSWMIKYALLRGGGLKQYRKGIPFFLGLMLGQFISGSIWSLVGIIFNKLTYSFFV